MGGKWVASLLLLQPRQGADRGRGPRAMHGPTFERSSPSFLPCRHPLGRSLPLPRVPSHTRTKVKGRVLAAAEVAGVEPRHAATRRQPPLRRPRQLREQEGGPHACPEGGERHEEAARRLAPCQPHGLQLGSARPRGWAAAGFFEKERARVAFLFQAPLVKPAAARPG